MACAVLVGGLLLRLPARTLALVSAVGFLAAAVMIIIRRDDEVERADGWSRGALACFASLFVTEWADPGQMMTVAAVARTEMPVVVWMAGSLAMITKALVALLFGAGLRDRLPRQTLRAVSAGSLAVLGLVTLATALVR